MIRCIPRVTSTDTIFPDTTLLRSEIGRDFGGSAICIQTDVRDRAQLLGMIDETVRRFGSVDILVNNAWGGGSFSRAEHKTDGEMEYGLSMNFWAAFWAMKAVFPHMRDRKSTRLKSSH